MFILCEQCGKKLIFIREDGALIFRFGRKHNEAPIVDIEIKGAVKLTCLRRSCNHITELSSGHNYS